MLISCVYTILSENIKHEVTTQYKIAINLSYYELITITPYLEDMAPLATCTINGLELPCEYPFTGSETLSAAAQGWIQTLAKGGA